MADVVQMDVFLAGDPAKDGKMDFAGMNAAYSKFFGTAEQPNKPVRAAMQVAALATAWGLVEIQVVAVPSKSVPMPTWSMPATLDDVVEVIDQGVEGGASDFGGELAVDFVGDACRGRRDLWLCIRLRGRPEPFCVRGPGLPRRGASSRR
jgi:hypothetical protein